MLKSNRRWLIIEPHNLSACVETKLRVTVQQPLFNATKRTWITLKPQKADLVAVLRADSQRVAYTGTAVLRAGGSHDPDGVQVKIGTKFIACVLYLAAFLQSCVGQRQQYSPSHPWLLF